MILQKVPVAKWLGANVVLWYDFIVVTVGA